MTKRPRAALASLAERQQEEIKVSHEPKLMNGEPVVSPSQPEDEPVDPQGIDQRCRCCDDCVEDYLGSPEGMALLAHLFGHLLDGLTDQVAQHRLQGSRSN